MASDGDVQAVFEAIGPSSPPEKEMPMSMAETTTQQLLAKVALREAQGSPKMDWGSLITGKRTTISRAQPQ